MVECAFAKSIKQNPKYCDVESRDLEELNCRGSALTSSHRKLPYLRAADGSAVSLEGAQ